MQKKILFTIISAVVVVSGIAALSAFEAHIINVTAHIENSLSVNTYEIEFGTVFPQEKLEQSLNIYLSDSFSDQERVDLIDYKIVQKPKPLDPQNAEWCHNWVTQNGLLAPIEPGFDLFSNKEYLEKCYPPLCFYLSKEPDNNPANDTGLPAYHRLTDIAYGTLQTGEDPSDQWTIDLDVPCFKGQCAQEWQHPGWEPPAELNEATFGCDLWVEVTGISEGGECVPTTEICNDRLDNDCDGYTDCGDANCYEDPACQSGPTPECEPGVQISCETGLLGICALGTRTCDLEGFWGECIQNKEPSTEVCDGLDNNCDGQVDEGELWQNKGESCSVGIGECQASGTYVCDSGNQSGPTICSATPGTPTTEVCDGLDNDCDGYTDENAVDALTLYADNDNDTYGNPNFSITSCTPISGYVTDNTDCDDNASYTYPGAPELCDGVDNNCDGRVDEGCSANYLLISEVLYDSLIPDPSGEWIEIYNPTASAIDLSNYKIGDEETQGGAEGMYKFPNGTSIAPGEFIVIAYSGGSFFSVYGFYPDFEYGVNTYQTINMIPYSPTYFPPPAPSWCTGACSLGLNNIGDEVLLLNGSDNPVDVVVYGIPTPPSYPGVIPHPGVVAGHSIARSPVNQDTDNCANDFVDRVSPTPGS